MDLDDTKIAPGRLAGLTHSAKPTLTINSLTPCLKSADPFGVSDYSRVETHFTVVDAMTQPAASQFKGGFPLMGEISSLFFSRWNKARFCYLSRPSVLETYLNNSPYHLTREQDHMTSEETT